VAKRSCGAGDRRDHLLVMALARPSAVSEAKAIVSVMLAFRAIRGSRRGL